MRRLILGLLLAFVGPVAFAQQTAPFIPSGNYTAVTASASSGNATLPASSPAVQLKNTGGVDVSCVFANSQASAVAVANRLIVPAGGSKTLGVPQGMTWVACIDQTGSTSTVVVVAGGAGPGSDTGSSVVTTVPSGTQDVNLTEVAGVTLGAPSTYGTSPGAVVAPGVNAFVTNPVASTIADGADVTLGAKADAKSAATDTTPITLMSVSKQISASIQAAAASLAGTLTVATHAVTQSGTWTVQPGNTANTTAWKVDGSAVTQPVSGTVTTNIAAATTGGCTPYHLANGSAATTNSTSIKGSAGTLCELTVINTTATIYYLKLYNASSAPTCSSATGLVHVYPIPASATGAGLQRTLTFGEAYGTGIGFCLTASGTDTANDNAATGVFIEAGYK